ELEGATILDRVLSAARPAVDPLVVVGPRRATTVHGVRFVREAQPGGGPVPAVIAGLDQMRGADVVVLLAGDLPLLAAYRAPRLRAAARELKPGAPAQRLLPRPVTTVNLGSTATLNVNFRVDLERAARLLDERRRPSVPGPGRLARA
ncbi:MAG: nucleotidyltransferase family protein, partial [Actinobacteria bacterium]|nr:nucleotidyltransferase family protein [Actinomycetota bacterium]